MKLPVALSLLAFALSATAADWINISDPITSRVKPGYGGPTSGITVDPANGDVFLVISDQGLWRSADKGANFTRCDDKNIGGRCETGWALQADPSGRRLACFMIYGSSAATANDGDAWSKFSTSHLDFGSVDWADTGARFLAIRHESGGMLTTSEDGGKTWTDLGKGYNGVGVIDHNTFLATKLEGPGIFRSTDAGANWTRVCAETPSAATPFLFQGVLYWATGKDILVSKDKGASWTALGTPVDATYGPYFDSPQHFVVVGKTGFQETKDGGATWQPAAPLPPAYTITGRVGPSFAWDSKADLFYASAMTKPAFKLERKEPSK